MWGVGAGFALVGERRRINDFPPVPDERLPVSRIGRAVLHAAHRIHVTTADNEIVGGVLDLGTPHALKGAQPVGRIGGELLRSVLGLFEKGTENVIEIEKDA